MTGCSPPQVKAWPLLCYPCGHLVGEAADQLACRPSAAAVSSKDATPRAQPHALQHAARLRSPVPQPWHASPLQPAQRLSSVVMHTLHSQHWRLEPAGCAGCMALILAWRQGGAPQPESVAACACTPRRHHQHLQRVRYQRLDCVSQPNQLRPGHCGRTGALTLTCMRLSWRCMQRTRC